MIIYKNKNYKVPLKKFSSSISKLSDEIGPCRPTLGFFAKKTWNDCISSIKVAPGYEAILYEKDNEQQIHDKFLNLIHFDTEKEKLELKKAYAKGFNEKKIFIYEITLTKQRHVNKFLTNLIKNIDKEQIKQILSQLNDKLDDNLDFFIRFDKDEYLKNNKLILTYSGNCFHIKISIAAFPKKREIGLEIVKEIFSSKS